MNRDLLLIICPENIFLTKAAFSSQTSVISSSYSVFCHVLLYYFVPDII